MCSIYSLFTGHAAELRYTMAYGEIPISVYSNDITLFQRYWNSCTSLICSIKYLVLKNVIIMFHFHVHTKDFGNSTIYGQKLIEKHFQMSNIFIFIFCILLCINEFYLPYTSPHKRILVRFRLLAETAEKNFHVYYSFFKLS